MMVWRRFAALAALLALVSAASARQIPVDVGPEEVAARSALQHSVDAAEAALGKHLCRPGDPECLGSLSAGLQGLGTANVSSGPPVKHPGHKLRWRPAQYDEPPRKQPAAAAGRQHGPTSPPHPTMPKVDCSGPHPAPPSDPCHPPLVGDAVDAEGKRRLQRLERASAAAMDQRRTLELAQAKTALDHLFTGTMYEDEKNAKLIRPL